MSYKPHPDVQHAIAIANAKATSGEMLRHPWPHLIVLAGEAQQQRVLAQQYKAFLTGKHPSELGPKRPEIRIAEALERIATALEALAQAEATE